MFLTVGWNPAQVKVDSFFLDYHKLNSGICIDVKKTWSRIRLILWYYQSIEKVSKKITEHHLGGHDPPDGALDFFIH